MTDVLLCVGNCMMGDDGAGPLLAELCADHPPAGWQVIDGGAAPENDIGHIRELRPDRLVIVDATDMGLAPGETRVIDEKDIAAMFIMTTHNLPLNFLIDQLREDIAEITFIGIQPEVVAFYYPISAAVKQAVTVLHQRLFHWADNGGYPQLEVTNV
ncbi:hydrogenase maturation peptidase HycI [Serratia liquefaciens]|uniref:hydrogenase maturation peptidase HycI n=1 Tax=Serratia liquefaciens TaxID=614 RepID=UPI000DFE95FF|nr:hydrogenase maturation peptidase HycI [Serratia liquefaciens]RYM88261.1 hydrogenase maturation peptidase HycI [Serratia liquefaciens]SUI55749.1 Hydrogenase 3 maturation protease [Serratia liquefaciens]